MPPNIIAPKQHGLTLYRSGLTGGNSCVFPFVSRCAIKGYLRSIIDVSGHHGIVSFSQRVKVPV
jgi:hypothetical protein